jgi:type I restriction enzyme S subunit
MNWKFSSLAEVASPESNSFVDGPFGSNLKASEYLDEGVPIIRLQNIKPNYFVPKDIKFISSRKADQLSRHSFQPGDLVIAKLGDPCAVACLIPEDFPDGRIVADVVRFRGDPKRVDHCYVSYFLNSPAAKAQIDAGTTGTTRKRVNLTKLKRIQLPLPPLAEQKRIAAILNTADDLRTKRRESLAQLDTLLQSTFLDLFGDPERNGWEMATVEHISDDRKGAIRTGPFGSQLLHSEFVDSGIAVLGIDNAVQNEFQWAERRFITPAKYRQLERYTVYPGDVLITIMGTCGRCAIVPEDIPTAINTKHLCCITLDQKKCLPSFLHSYFLLHPIARQYLAQTAKGAIMSGLNMGIIKAMPIPLAPISLQKEHSKLVAAVESQKQLYRDQLEELDTLFASLQSRAFRGEL